MCAENGISSTENREFRQRRDGTKFSVKPALTKHENFNEMHKRDSLVSLPSSLVFLRMKQGKAR